MMLTCSGLWSESLAEKFVLYATTHSYYIKIIEIQTMLLEDYFY